MIMAAPRPEIKHIILLVIISHQLTELFLAVRTLLLSANTQHPVLGRLALPGGNLGPRPRPRPRPNTVVQVGAAAVYIRIDVVRYTVCSHVAIRIVNFRTAVVVIDVLSCLNINLALHDVQILFLFCLADSSLFSFLYQPMLIVVFKFTFFFLPWFCSGFCVLQDDGRGLGGGGGGPHRLRGLTGLTALLGQHLHSAVCLGRISSCYAGFFIGKNKFRSTKKNIFSVTCDI